MSADDSDSKVVDSAPTEPPRARFRRHLRSGETDLDQVRRYIASAASQFELDVEARLALEELVSHLGWLLGFDPERDEAAELDVWSSRLTALILVQVASGATLIGRVLALSRARERLLALSSVPARNVSILCVVSGSPPNWRQLEDVIVVRRLGDHVRVVSSEALLALASARSTGLRHADALAILRPQGARADALVDILVRGLTEPDPGPTQA